MNNIEMYFKQFEQLLQKIIYDGQINEYEDGTETLSICEFEEDESGIIEESSKEKKSLKPIQVLETTEDGWQTFSEEMSLRILSEYLQNHQEFEFEMTQESPFSQYVTKRFRSIAEKISLRLNNGMQIPYLNRDEDNSKRIPIGYTYYDAQENKFSLVMNNEEIEDKSAYDAIPLVFNYMYQRSNLEFFINLKNSSIDPETGSIDIEKMKAAQKGINEIPLGYREPVKYREAKEEPSDDLDFLR